MVKRSISIILISVLLLAVVTGCQNEKKAVKSQNQVVLTIKYDDSIYGTEWIEKISDKFKKANKNIQVKLIPDSKINQTATALLESGKNLPDIMFLQNTNWEYWASKDYLYDLTGLFTSVVDGGKTLLSKIKPDCIKHCEYEGRYYAVPWDDGVAGLLYNKTMFETNGWNVPTTMTEFYELLDKIKLSGIVPIAWDGNNISDWNYAVRTWWAQSEGRNNINTYLALQSPEVYLQTGREESLKIFEKIVTDAKNNMQDVLNADQAKAQKLFFSSNAAMLLGGSWIAAKNAIPANFKIGIMRFPSIDNANDAEINVSAGGGFAVVPSKAANKKSAVEFLRFMSTDKMLMLYCEITSSPRPFNFKFSEDAKLNDFGREVMQIWEKDDNLYMFSDNQKYYNLFGDWPMSGFPYLQIYSGKKTPHETVEENYEYVKANWDR